MRGQNNYLFKNLYKKNYFFILIILFYFILNIQHFLPLCLENKQVYFICPLKISNCIYMTESFMAVFFPLNLGNISTILASQMLYCVY